MAKQLSLSDRFFIERSLHNDLTFASIARALNRSASTISREVKKYRVFTNRFPIAGENDCIHRPGCLRNSICEDAPIHGCYFYRCKTCPDHNCTLICDKYESSYCSLLEKPPYVCHGCKKEKSCKKIHAYYTAHRADAEHRKIMKEAHSGIRKSPEELIALGELITPLIRKGQSLNHICATHGNEIGVSERTLYNYIDANVFSIRNIDLPKKCAYRKRRQERLITKFDYRYRRGRTLDDFNSYLEENPDASVVEMDTVKGKLERGKVLLTMIFRKTDFMLVFLLPDGTQKSVLQIFDSLTITLGLELFRKLFQVILTDNGVEFKDADSLEHTLNGAQRTRLFYCDPQSAWQKPQVEKNHTFIRRIIPKSTSFNFLNAEDVKRLTCHINSVLREQFGNRTPFEMMYTREQQKLLSLLDLHAIPPDEVLLKPALVKH
ncbi:MAG: IS30 family transposase [Firmicutes bacterium]|nr:IS30 family transposase [Bacillota bacterium]